MALIYSLLQSDFSDLISDFSLYVRALTDRQVTNLNVKV